MVHCIYHCDIAREKNKFSQNSALSCISFCTKCCGTCVVEIVVFFWVRVFVDCSVAQFSSHQSSDSTRALRAQLQAHFVQPGQIALHMICAATQTHLTSHHRQRRRCVNMSDTFPPPFLSGHNRALLCISVLLHFATT